MAKPNMECRVCGKEYFCCSDSKRINSWRAMACSPECYQEYMKRIEISRSPVVEKEVKTRSVSKNIRNKTTTKANEIIEKEATTDEVGAEEIVEE